MTNFPFHIIILVQSCVLFGGDDASMACSEEITGTRPSWPTEGGSSEQHITGYNKVIMIKLSDKNTPGLSKDELRKYTTCKDMPGYVRTYPDINFAVLKWHKHRHLRLWYLLRDLDKSGSGRLMRKKAQKALEPIMSQEVFRVTLIAGEGKFWEVKDRRDAEGGGQLIELYGLAKVALSLGITKLTKSPRLIPLEAFSDLRTFKALIYASWFDNDDPNPISRATIKDLSGLSIPTQVTYDKLSATQVTKNVAIIGPDLKEVPDNMKEVGYYKTVIKNKEQLCKRLPNSYFCNLPQAPQRSIRRANNRLAASGRGAEDTVFERMYFKELECSSKARNKATFSYVRQGNFGTTRLWKGIMS